MPIVRTTGPPFDRHPSMKGDCVETSGSHDRMGTLYSGHKYINEDTFSSFDIC